MYVPVNHYQITTEALVIRYFNFGSLGYVLNYVIKIAGLLYCGRWRHCACPKHSITIYQSRCNILEDFNLQRDGLTMLEC
jgi:hypothetical protein